jgi:hypothetical protein
VSCIGVRTTVGQWLATAGKKTWPQLANSWSRLNQQLATPGKELGPHELTSWLRLTKSTSQPRRTKGGKKQRKSTYIEGNPSLSSRWPAAPQTHGLQPCSSTRSSTEQRSGLRSCAPACRTREEHDRFVGGSVRCSRKVGQWVSGTVERNIVRVRRWCYARPCWRARVREGMRNEEWMTDGRWQRDAALVDQQQSKTEQPLTFHSTCRSTRVCQTP